MKYFVKSRIGLILQGIRDDELSVAVLGKNVFAYKMVALGFSAMFAGFAGGFLVHYLTFLDPNIFEINYLVILLSMVIVGGLSTLEGSVLGVLVISIFTIGIRFLGFSPAVLGPLRDIVYALLLILVLVFRPRGILGRVDLE